MKRICVIGGGRWGRNHIKTLSQMGALAAVVEKDGLRLKALTEEFKVKGYAVLEDAIRDGYDGYTVAVPAPLHYETAKKLLLAGQNVLVEKPFTLVSTEAAELVSIARKMNVRLMVGHLLLFHPAIIKIKELIDKGKIGKLFYIYSNRLNLGTVRTEENVFWSLAPHDISILDYFIGKSTVSVSATAQKFLQKDIYDSTVAHLVYPDNVHAHIFTSWLHPFKEHRLVVIGSKGMLVYEDSSADKNIIFYDKRIEFDGGLPLKVEAPDEIIDYERKMPLAEELRYFIGHIDSEIGIAGGESALEVVRVLEQVQKIIDKG